ncbi:hypothetical protein [Anaerosporobacter sp.]
MIQAVLFRELICYGYEDIGMDLLVKNYYIPKDIPFSDYQICKMFGIEKIQKRCSDCSTGLGQIFAKTAIDAERGINRNYKLDSNKEEDLWKMWKKLQDDETNIYYVALVLKNEARKLNIDISKATRQEQIKVIGQYNGNIAYGKAVIEYYDIFHDFNKMIKY